MAMWTRCPGQLQADVQARRLPSKLAWTLFGLPFALTLLVGTSLLHKPLFRYLTAEDSLLEWVQFAWFLAAGVLGLVAVARLRTQHRTAAVLLAVFAAGALLSAGEEVSWGQRVFGWGTPEALTEVNHQGETNLHNITTVPVQKTFNLLQLAAGFYGGVLAVILRGLWHKRPVLVELLLPVAFLAPAFLLMFLYRLVRLTLVTEMRFVDVKLGVLPETTLAARLRRFRAGHRPSRRRRAAAALNSARRACRRRGDTVARARASASRGGASAGHEVLGDSGRTTGHVVDSGMLPSSASPLSTAVTSTDL